MELELKLVLDVDLGAGSDELLQQCNATLTTYLELHWQAKLKLKAIIIAGSLIRPVAPKCWRSCRVSSKKSFAVAVAVRVGVGVGRVGEIAAVAADRRCGVLRQCNFNNFIWCCARLPWFDWQAVYGGIQQRWQIKAFFATIHSAGRARRQRSLITCQSLGSLGRWAVLPLLLQMFSCTLAATETRWQSHTRTHTRGHSKRNHQHQRKQLRLQLWLSPLALSPFPSLSRSSSLSVSFSLCQLLASIADMPFAICIVFVLICLSSERTAHQSAQILAQKVAKHSTTSSWEKGRRREGKRGVSQSNARIFLPRTAACEWENPSVDSQQCPSVEYVKNLSNPATDHWTGPTDRSAFLAGRGTFPWTDEQVGKTTTFAVGQLRDPVNVRIFENLGVECDGVSLGFGRWTGGYKLGKFL